MNNKYGCVNDSGLEWAGRYLALFSLSTVSGYGGGKKNVQRKKFRWQIQAHFFSQLHWCIFTAKLLLLVHEIYRRILACRNRSQIYPYSFCIVLDFLGKKIITLIWNILQLHLYSTLYVICLDID